MNATEEARVYVAQSLLEESPRLSARMRDLHTQRNAMEPARYRQLQRNLLGNALQTTTAQEIQRRIGRWLA